MEGINVKRFNQTRFSAYMSKTSNLHAEKLGRDHPIQDLLHLELNGGPCPKCGKSWNQCNVDNSAGKFAYYDPACRCYGRCPKCGTSLHREEADGDKCHKCVSCGWDPTKRKVHRVRCDNKCGNWFSMGRRRKNHTTDESTDLIHEKISCPKCERGSRGGAEAPQF